MQPTTVVISKIIKFCAFIFILSKLLIIFEYFLADYIIKHGNGGFSGLLDALWKFDSSWYQKIAEQGYDNSFDPVTQGRDGNTLGFFPLWPLILKIFSLNSLLPIKITGFILNQIFYFSSLIIFYLYLLRSRFNDSDIQFTLITLVISPANLFFNNGLTENLFLLLSLLAFYFLITNKVGLCLICGMFLSITRMTGAMFLIPMVYHFLFIDKIKPLKVLFYAVITLSGLLLFMLYMLIHTGDALVFLTIQNKVSGWARPGLNYSIDIYQQIRSIYTHATVYDSTIYLISLFAICGMLLYKKRIEECLFNFCCIVPVFISGSLWNSLRFTTCLFTFYIGITALSGECRTYKQYLQYFIIAVIAIMSMVVWLYNISGSWYFD